GVEVSVEQIKPGPRVTQFGVAPGWIRRQRGARGASTPSLEQLARVRVDNILAREKDLTLALKAPSLRMEAPVPGEALVGVEVPNPDPLLVALRAVVEDRRFQEIWLKGGLPLALGQSTGGQAVAVDLREMPHLLIAGATGSGKSVCINGIISALILTQPPDKLRLLLIDPKRVELTPFNGIPHLIAPVILDSDLVVTALKGMLREMQRRYNLFEKLRVRNIEAYKQHPQGTVPMPYLVLIIDELADLMMASSYEVEHSLVRLSQLGRATGIHLVIATQRPSVNVVTGLLKANISSRISFAVASQVDSRVILDGAGAEKLLGRGDMLFLSPDAVRPHRLQGTFVSDGEVEGLADFWKSQHGPPLPVIPVLEEAPEPVLEEESAESDDELLGEARSLAQRYSHVSPSLLQRRLRIGYPRAARLLDLLEEEGSVGPGEPGKSRPVQKLR
ncbi:MAG: DNA translocase FtsK, partial [Dehalococcoidia bacterium]